MKKDIERRRVLMTKTDVFEILANLTIVMIIASVIFMP